MTEAEIKEALGPVMEELVRDAGLKVSHKIHGILTQAHVSLPAGASQDLEALRRRLRGETPEAHAVARHWWRPIETCPTADGLRALVCWEDTVRVRIATWSEKHRGWIDSAPLPHIYELPSHWMPVPDRPPS